MFDTLLNSEWDRAVSQGLFTFQIDHHVKRRILDDGDLQYIIELNPSQCEKRRMTYPFEDVNKLFDNNKFNSNKIKDAERMNNRPYHVLIVPDRELEQSQVLTIDCVLFGLQFVASSAHSYIFAGFNSICESSWHKCYLFDLLDTQTFTFEIQHIDELDKIVLYVYKITNYLTSQNIAQNIAIVKGDSFSSSSAA